MNGRRAEPKRFLRWNPFELALAEILKPSFQLRDDCFIDQPIVLFVDSEQKALGKNNPSSAGKLRAS